MAFLSGHIQAGTVTRYDYIQASEAPVMKARFEKYLSDLAAENAALAAAQKPQLNVLDVDIAGGGTGHTFALRILVSTAESGAIWPGDGLGLISSEFWLGSDAAALGRLQAAALARLIVKIPPDGEFEDIFVGLAGASQGTRFMAFIAGELDQGS
jgi:hypothetical protein